MSHRSYTTVNRSKCDITLYRVRVCVFFPFSQPKVRFTLPFRDLQIPTSLQVGDLLLEDLRSRKTDHETTPVVFGVEPSFYSDKILQRTLPKVLGVKVLNR